MAKSVPASKDRQASFDDAVRACATCLFIIAADKKLLNHEQSAHLRPLLRKVTPIVEDAFVRTIKQGEVSAHRKQQRKRA